MRYTCIMRVRPVCLSLFLTCQTKYMSTNFFMLSNYKKNSLLLFFTTHYVFLTTIIIIFWKSDHFYSNAINVYMYVILVYDNMCFKFLRISVLFFCELNSEKSFRFNNSRSNFLADPVKKLMKETYEFWRCTYRNDVKYRNATFLVN